MTSEPQFDKRPRLSGTDLIHADDAFHGVEVSSSISVTTTFRAPRPATDATPGDDEIDEWNPSRHRYSRHTQNVSTRVEKVLSKITGGYAVTYASGLAAAHAALVHLRPTRIAITGGYSGTHATLETYKRSRGDLPIIGIDDPFQPGDICWLETPVNPTGEVRDIKYYADKVHAVGGHLLVDSTFAPPPLQNPFKWGADVVIHSATKYLGGHCDLLSGVVVVPTVEKWKDLWSIRTFHGSVMGSLEAWLLLRSLRTLHLRVPRQSETATALARWLNQAAGGKAVNGIPAGMIEKVHHSSLQGTDSRGFEPTAQMEGGWNATFAIILEDEFYAKFLPHELEYFVPATSLGGVESLIEQRVQSDPGEDTRLVRISVGLEDLQDLKSDLRNAFQRLVKART